MTLDTLGYVKHLERAGVERKIAEAHAEALMKYVIPALARPPATQWMGLRSRSGAEWWVLPAVAFFVLVATLIAAHH
jgi:hypothetical protein